MAKPIKRNDIRTPEQNDNACCLIFRLDSLPIETKLNILREIIGNTHGIRFRIRPPRNAKIKACKNVTSSELDSFLSS